MPILLPAEPWKTTGRWELYGETLFRLTGPARARDAARPDAGGGRGRSSSPRDLPSYRDLPVNLYQVEWKYRDEFRPRFGLLRVREFLMKDAYTFDRDEEGMAALLRRRCSRRTGACSTGAGSSYVVVEAEPGQIGGGVNHEFMARADVGEDLFVECVNGDYLADWKAATPAPARARVRGRSSRRSRRSTRPTRRRSTRSRSCSAVPAERTLKTHAVRRGRRRPSRSCSRATGRSRRPRSSGCCSRRRSAGSRTPTSRARGS